MGKKISFVQSGKKIFNALTALIVEVTSLERVKNNRIGSNPGEMILSDCTHGIGTILL